MIYSTHLGNEPDYDANNPIVRGSQPVQEEEYLTDAITRESVDFIDRHADKPFFLFVSYNAVHSPLQATDEYMDKFKRQQVKFSKATKGKNPAKTVDMVLDDGRSDSLAAAIRNAIANATPNKESEDEDEDEDEDEESSDEL